jgi:hypothetical protein
MQQSTSASTLTASPRTSAGMADTVAESLGTGMRDERLAALRETLALPTTARGFLLFFLALMLVTTGIVMQIFLSVQIRATQVAVDEAAASAALIEQRNTELMWEIAEATSVEQVRRRALALGYRPIETPRYMERPAVTVALAPPKQTADAAGVRATQSGMDDPSTATTPRATAAAAAARTDAVLTVTPEDEQWTSGLVTRLRADATEAIRNWLAAGQSPQPRQAR